MRVYADSSVILRLITGEPGPQQAAAEYAILDALPCSTCRYTPWRSKMEFANAPFTSDEPSLQACAQE